MAVSPPECHTRLNGARIVTPRRIGLALCLCLLVSLPGCGGCSCRMRAKTQAELDQEKVEAERRLQLERERLKPPIETKWLVSEPYDPGVKTPNFYYKPGHWAAGMLSAIANHDDIVGDLQIAVTDVEGKPLGLVATPYTLSTHRSVALPKKTPKRLQSQLFFPATPEKAHVTTQITTQRGSRIFEGPAQLSTRMPAHQYYLVVLARWPQRYTYVEALRACRIPKTLSLDDNSQDLYRVVLLLAEKQTTVPAYCLFWTSTACVLWDDAEPDALTMDQQRALIDWLHWGGQLIISGPESLDSLKDSFLGPYLPAVSSGVREIQKADLAELNQHWPVEAGTGSKTVLPLAPTHSWSGVHLKLNPDPQARFVPKTGELVAERSVGRGRVVVSSFALSASDLTAWAGFDAFFNGCLLGRQGRVFGEHDGQATMRFRNGAMIREPREACQLRYFTRDTGREFVPPKPSGEIGASLAEEEPTVLPSDVASWNDANSVANAARESLKEAARIEIPNRTFVVWVVGVYLIVLVPLNWIIFRALDRVEWAWVAAPLIAVACTVLVIRLAQLDIGFARSTTEISTIELQGGHPRAHVTRYTALYTSLSTEYRFSFEDPGALVLPFPTRLDDLTVRFGRTNLQSRYGKDTELNGLRILSNSTGLVHSEQMLDLGGGITLRQTKEGTFELTNATKLTLHGTGVLRRDEKNRLYVAWLDDVDPSTKRSVPFEPRPEGTQQGSPWSELRDKQPQTTPKASSTRAQTNRERAAGTLSLRALTDLAEKEVLRPGDARLVAWTAEPLPGMQIAPAAPQARHVSLVVANLGYGHRAPESDVNTPAVVADSPRVLNAE